MLSFLATKLSVVSQSGEDALSEIQDAHKKSVLTMHVEWPRRAGLIRTIDGRALARIVLMDTTRLFQHEWRALERGRPLWSSAE